jgi:V/A-type H+/Na+-transporting ATPase subunit D
VLNGQPPGRAGRIWLRARLESARRGVDLLDRKRQLLRRELERLALHRDEALSNWTNAAAAADLWGVRATALGGVSDLAPAIASVAGRSQVEVPYLNTMSVIHPGEPRATLAELPRVEAAAANAAVAPAASAYRRALQAAAAAAAADTAFRVLDTERQATERHLRAIERRRIPSLEAAIRDLELRLEEMEREERVVTRWAKQRRDAERASLGGGLESDGHARPPHR